MVSVPALTGVTIPPALMVAWALLLLHTPPADPSLSVIAEPTHTLAGPLMLPALGNGVTVTGWVAVAVPQLEVMVYMIVSTPPLTPVTDPVPVTVAFALLLLHTPPAVASVRAMDEPAHTPDAPVMLPAVRNAPMVIVFVMVDVPQLLVIEYRIVSVPVVTPVSKPLMAFIVAFGLVVLHIPPAVASV